MTTAPIDLWSRTAALLAEEDSRLEGLTLRQTGTRTSARSKIAILQAGGPWDVVGLATGLDFRAILRTVARTAAESMGVAVPEDPAWPRFEFVTDAARGALPEFPPSDTSRAALRPVPAPEQESTPPPPPRGRDTPHAPNPEDFRRIAREIGDLVAKKNAAYGNAFNTAGEALRLLYPEGIRPEQYDDALAVVRIWDKLMRIATARDALGESPFRDIAGYGLLGTERVERAREVSSREDT